MKKNMRKIGDRTGIGFSSEGGGPVSKTSGRFEKVKESEIDAINQKI